MHFVGCILEYSYDARTHECKIELDVNANEIRHGVNVFAVEITWLQVIQLSQSSCNIFGGKIFNFGKGTCMLCLARNPFA
jgi:hypothetical protein